MGRRGAGGRPAAGRGKRRQRREPGGPLAPVVRGGRPGRGGRHDAPAPQPRRHGVGRARATPAHPAAARPRPLVGHSAGPCPPRGRALLPGVRVVPPRRDPPAPAGRGLPAHAGARVPGDGRAAAAHARPGAAHHVQAQPLLPRARPRLPADQDRHGPALEPPPGPARPVPAHHQAGGGAQQAAPRRARSRAAHGSTGVPSAPHLSHPIRLFR